MPPVNLKSYLAAVSLLIIGALIKYIFDQLQPSSKLVLWCPHQFLFDRVANSVSIHTQTYTLQNLGRKTCEDIEIIHKHKPDFFKLSPARYYQDEMSPDNQHVIKIDSLGPKEFLSIEILSYTQLPELQIVRSKEGPVVPVGFLIQQVQPRWKVLLVQILLVTGIGTLFYWVQKLIVTIWGWI